MNAAVNSNFSHRGKVLRFPFSWPFSLRLLTAGAALAALSACEPVIDLRGNHPDPQSLALIKPGLQHRDDVVDLLGSPSTVDTFDSKSAWFYISKTTSTVAFFQPEILEQQVVEIDFDKEGVVNRIKTLTLADAHDVTPVARTTPTAGNELTFMQQLMINVGRYGKKDKDKESQ